MVSREIPLPLLTGLGFKMVDKDKKTWMISAKAEECIKKEMDIRGFGNGRVKSENLRGVGTLYTFVFSPFEAPGTQHVYTMSYLGGDVSVEIDSEHIDSSKTPSEEGKSTEDIGEARLNAFFKSIEKCQRGYVFRAAPKAPPPFAEPRPEVSDDPYGMAAAFGRMGIREGGRRRATKRKSMRRRLSKKKRFT